MSKILPKNIAQAIYKATKGKSGQELRDTLARAVAVMHKKRLLGRSEEILKALQEIADKETKTVRAKIITAQRIVGETRRNVERKIKEKYRAEVLVSDFLEAPNILGGMRVEVGEEVYDNTYQGKLTKLRKFLIK